MSSLKSEPIDIKNPRKLSNDFDHPELEQLFHLKMRLTDLINEYIQFKIDVNLKKYYDNLTIQLTNEIVEQIDKSTSKIAEKFIKN